MKRSRAVAMVAAVLAMATLHAQQPPSRPASPTRTASAQVGGQWVKGERGMRYENGKWIDITYSRPMLRGRTEIFGKGADYGKAVNGGAPVWRVGANQTTKLKTEVPLTLGGKRLEPGSYDLFVELKEGAWTLIVSTQPTQDQYDPKDETRIWGSYGYDPKFDVVRVPMTMLAPAVSVDQFTIEFVDMTDAGGKLAMAWEKTGAFVPFTVAK